MKIPSVTEGLLFPDLNATKGIAEALAAICVLNHSHNEIPLRGGTHRISSITDRGYIDPTWCRILSVFFINRRRNLYKLLKIVDSYASFELTSMPILAFISESTEVTSMT